MKCSTRFSFLRKPFKLFLVVLLTVLISTAALVFSLQAYLDGIVMDHAMNSTAYVGTVYSRMHKYPMIKELPDSIFSMLESSPSVDAVMISPTYSGKAEGLNRVADGFGNVEAMNMKLFLEGTVDSKPALTPGGFGMMETFILKISTKWGGAWTSDGIEVRIFRDKQTDAPCLKEGDHVFLVGRYNSSPTGDVTGMILYDPEMLDDLKLDTDSAIWNHSILMLSDDLTEEESAARIEQFLLDSGLQEPLALMNQITDVFPIHEVTDMSMLLTVADGTTFITEGRELHGGDYGNRVCVINEAVARQNGLDVGDTIRLGVAEGAYTYNDHMEEYRGWNSGYPFEKDTMLQYKEYSEYTIVGLYSEIDRKIGSPDFNHYSRNDIFIPAGLLPAYDGNVQSQALTFRVLGPDYEDFMDTFEVPLNEQGYSLTIVDAGWDAMSSSFYAMSDRKLLMTACAVIAFAAAVLSFGVLISNHFRYEYALRRLLGAKPSEAREVFLSAFAVTALPAGVIAMLCSFGAYILWLKDQLSATLPIALPTISEILGYLGMWTIVELAATFMLLLGLSRITSRQNLIKLLK